MFKKLIQHITDKLFGAIFFCHKQSCIDLSLSWRALQLMLKHDSFRIQTSGILNSERVRES